MSRYSSSDGMLRVFVVTTIADIQAPTVAELNAGTHITSFITKDGLTVPSDQNTLDIASAAENFNAAAPGSFGGNVEITGLRDNAADTLWDLITYDLSRYLAVRRGFPTATAWAATQPAEIYPVAFNHPVPEQIGGDEPAKFTISAPCWLEPALKAVVAA